MPPTTDAVVATQEAAAAEIARLRALVPAEQRQPPAPDPVADAPSVEVTDHDTRLAALEATLGQRPNPGAYRLVTLSQPRRVTDADVDPSRIAFKQNDDGVRILYFDGKACGRGVVVVNGEPCYVDGGPVKAVEQ